MRRNWAGRMAVISGVTAMMVVVSAGTALADNKSIGDEHGTMTFIDDGDMFKVCDTRADGHGVVGKLIKHDFWTTADSTVLTVDDGGDNGCDSGGYNIGNLHSYQMRLYWNGHEVDRSAWFNE
jgi:hypothetical protein